MKEADRLLEDAALLESVYEAQGKRRHSRTLGRLQTPAEVVLRLLLLKHARNWAIARWGGKCARIWCIAHLPQLTTEKYRT